MAFTHSRFQKIFCGGLPKVPGFSCSGHLNMLLYPMFFPDDVNKYGWTSKALQGFVCIGYLTVLNILGVCATTL